MAAVFSVSLTTTLNNLHVGIATRGAVLNTVSDLTDPASNVGHVGSAGQSTLGLGDGFGNGVLGLGFVLGW